MQWNYDNYKYNNNRDYQETYHDSLRREKESRTSPTSKWSGRYYDHKDKLGDSGIENDFKRDGTTPRSSTQRREYLNDSEDEGFASSLLIASERQHTEDMINRKKGRDYDSDRDRDDSYRRLENHYMTREYKTRHDYAPRERSIDDGSHFDPRLDKEVVVDVDSSTLKKKNEKKPPKPEKKSGLERVSYVWSNLKLDVST